MTPPAQLVSAKRSLWAAVWLQRSIEACHKAADRIRALETRYEELKGYQVAELQWHPSGADAALTKVEEHRAAIVRLLAAIVPDLVTTPTDPGLPDVLGPARAWIADELVSIMERKEDTGFADLFTPYFTASLATHDHFVTLMRDTGRENYIYVAVNTMLDVMDVSGFALLFSELDGTSFAGTVKTTWDRYLSRIPDASKNIAGLYAAIESRLGGPIFSSSAMRRQEWGRRFAGALHSRGIDTERDFDPFRGHPRVSHPSPIIESVHVMYGHPMDEPHEYFGALYLSVRAEANGLGLPRAVKDRLRSIDLARKRLEKQNHEPANEIEDP